MTTLPPLNVLVVDDRPANLLAMRATLSGPNYRIIEATSGAEAVRIALCEPVDLVLLDVVIPDMDGFEVAARLKQIERTAKVPIIFLTAVATEMREFYRAFDVGAVDYLTKPVDAELLKRKVAVFAELVRQRREVERQAALIRESDRRQYELRIAQLRLANDRRYRRLVEGVDKSLAFTLDEERRLLFMSRQASLMLGYPIDELTKPGFFVERVHPEDRDRVDALFQRALDDHSEGTCTHRMTTADARTRWFVTHVSCEIDEDRRELHGISTDITDVKRAEEVGALHADVGAALLASRSFDLDEILSSVARRLIPVTGDWCLFDEIAPEGTRCLGAAHVDANRDLAALKAMRHATTLPEAELAAAPLPTSLADALGLGVDVVESLGVECYIRVPLPVRDPPQIVMTLVSASRRKFGPDDLRSARDLAERIALGVESARQYRAARLATRAREELLAVVSHDLRSPLSTISVASKLLANAAPRYQDEPSARAANATLRAAQLMERLIGDLLDVAQIDAGQLRIERAPVDVFSLIDDVIDAFRDSAFARQIELRAQLGSRQTVTLHADRHRLTQVLSNLVGNAIKFTPQNGRVLVVVEPLADHVRFSVSDTGPGIAEQDRDKIWKKFWRRARGEGGGVGLGLPIAKSLVEAHGGVIWCESARGKGTTFLFNVPRHAQARAPRPSPETSG